MAGRACRNRTEGSHRRAAGVDGTKVTITRDESEQANVAGTTASAPVERPVVTAVQP